MEGVECVCMGRGCVYGRGGVCVHGEREGVYMEGVQCAWGECVYMEGFECACIGEREGMCIWKGGVCVHD